MLRRRLVLIMVLSIIGLGTLLRFCGLGTNIQYGGIYHPDAGHQISTLKRFIGGDYLNFSKVTSVCNLDVYPNLTMHLIEWTYRLFRRVRFWALNLQGFRSPLESLDVLFKPNHVILYYWVRILLALMSCVTIYLIYRIGFNFFGVSVGILAGLLFALSPLSVDLVHVEMSDTSAVFFAICCLYYVSRNFKKEDLSNYIAASIAAGLATGAKYYGGIIIIFPIFTSLYFNAKKTQKGWVKFLFSYRIYLIFIAFCLGIFISMPHLWQNFIQKVKDTLKFIDHMANLDEGMRAIPRNRLFIQYLLENYRIIQSAVYPSIFYSGLTYTIFIFLYRRNFRYIMVAIFPILYFLITAYGRSYGMMALYYLITIPFFCLLAGLMLRELFIRRNIFSKSFSICMGIVLVGSLGYTSFESAYFFLHKDTRRFAEEWINRNVTPDLKVSGDKYSVDIPPVEGDVINNSGFYFSSSLGGNTIPSGGILIKEFSLENKIPPIIHRNPDIKVYFLPGDRIEKQFDIPEIPHKPLDQSEVEMIFVDGLDFGAATRAFQIEGRTRKFVTLVSYKKIEMVSITVTNDNFLNRVKMRLGGVLSKIRLSPYATKIIQFESPRRSFPYTKYFYRLDIRNRGESRIFIEISTRPKHEEIIPLKEIGIPPEYLVSVNRTIFRAEDLIVPYIKEIIDIDAFENKAVLLGDTSNILYGPYKFFPRGRWNVSFRLRLDKCIDTEGVGSIDVAGRSGQRLFGKIDLLEKDFINSRYKYFNIPIEIIEQAEVLEFRVKVNPGVNLAVDEITIEPNIYGLKG